jgi:hypothetical protein
MLAPQLSVSPASPNPRSSASSLHSGLDLSPIHLSYRLLPTDEFDRALPEAELIGREEAYEVEAIIGERLQGKKKETTWHETVRNETSASPMAAEEKAGITALQKADPTWRKIIDNIHMFEQFSLKDEVLYHKEAICLPSNKRFIASVLNDCHDANGHLGISKSYGYGGWIRKEERRDNGG